MKKLFLVLLIILSVNVMNAQVNVKTTKLDPACMGLSPAGLLPDRLQAGR